MSDYKYAYTGPEKGTAKALLKDMGVSTKVSIEIANYLRGRSTEKAKHLLQQVIAQKHAIPFKRFTDGVGHRSGNMASGRYPLKASEAFIALIELVEANASQAGLSDKLVIEHLLAQRASTPWKYGRQRRRKQKRTHLEIVVKEDESAPKKKVAKKAATKPAEKAEEKPKVETKPKAPAQAEVKEAPKAEPVKKASPAPAKSVEAKEKLVAEKRAEEKPTAEAKPEAKPEVKEAPKAETQDTKPEAKKENKGDTQ